MSDHEMLDEKVVTQHGSMQRVQRWWRGVHPDKGIIIRGLTGWETLEETDRILPVRTFVVTEG